HNVFFFSSRRRHTRFSRDWSSDVALPIFGARELAPVATIVGAFVFGFAIVLAGGCATGTFYRSSEGLIGSWFALVCYAGSAAVMKYGAFAELTAAARSHTVGLTSIHETLGISPWWLVAVLVLAV